MSKRTVSVEGDGKDILVRIPMGLYRAAKKAADEVKQPFVAFVREALTFTFSGMNIESRETQDFLAEAGIVERGTDLLGYQYLKLTPEAKKIAPHISSWLLQGGTW